MSLCDGPHFTCWSRRPIRFKITGDSLLIHESAYSLFIGLCSVTSNMTGYFHSYHSIKLIHWGAPQRDVLSDKMVLWVMTHSFYVMLCQSSSLTFPLRRYLVPTPSTKRGGGGEPTSHDLENGRLYKLQLWQIIRIIYER